MSDDVREGGGAETPPRDARLLRHSASLLRKFLLGASGFLLDDSDTVRALEEWADDLEREPAAPAVSEAMVIEAEEIYEGSVSRAVNLLSYMRGPSESRWLRIRQDAMRNALEHFAAALARPADAAGKVGACTVYDYQTRDFCGQPAAQRYTRPNGDTGYACAAHWARMSDESRFTAWPTYSFTPGDGAPDGR